MSHDLTYSSPTQVEWTCRALLSGRTIGHDDEITEVRGWRLAAIIWRLKRRYEWPILTVYTGPENHAEYKLDPAQRPPSGGRRCDMIELGTIRKNAAEEIRFTVETYKGREIVNIRVWYRDADGDYRPGKQGLAFRLELLGEVLDALGAARRGTLQ